MAKINILLAYIFERSDKMYRHILFYKKKGMIVAKIN